MRYTVTVELNETEYQVLEMYNNDVLIKDIEKELELTHSRYQRIFKKLRVMGLLKKRKRGNYRKNKYVPKNYSFNHTSGSFDICKKGRYFGCVRTQRQAERMVELLRECGWDYSCRDEIKRRVLSEC